MCRTEYLLSSTWLDFYSSVELNKSNLNGKTSNFKMAKVNQQNVSQANRRIFLIRSMFERARRLRRMWNGIIPTQCWEQENATDSSCNYFGTPSCCWQERCSPNTSFTPSTGAKYWLVEHHLVHILKCKV